MESVAEEKADHLLVQTVLIEVLKNFRGYRRSRVEKQNVVFLEFR
jgi:hypothetical protein